MIVQRPSSARGHVEAGWLDSRHTFSFGGYYDSAWMGFGPLRVINEDRVDPGAGFAPHRHANMEILSYVIDGALAHRDSAGGGGVIRAGELQWMSAGHGIEHSEFNDSKSEPVHFLQMWIQPSRLNHEPAYAQLPAVPADTRGWTLLASGDGRQGSLAIRQDARLSQVRLRRGATADHELDPSRLYWLHVAMGRLTVNGEFPLQAGDALGFQGEDTTLTLQGTGDEPALALLFDLPE